MSRLRIDDKPGEDTRYYVRSVLRFMADAFQAMEESKEKGVELSDYSMNGASQIMALCADALEEPDEDNGETHGR